MAPSKYRNPDWIIPQLVVLGGIEFIVCACCLFYSIYVYRRNDKPDPRDDGRTRFSATSLKYMNFCGVTSFLLCCIVQCINLWYWNVYYDDFSAIQTLTWYATWFLWSVGMFMTYSLFLHRIRTTFRKSAFAPSTITRYYLYILMTIYAMLWITASILPLFIYIDIGGGTMSRERVFEIESAFSLPIAAVDVLLTVSMTLIFVSRLHHLISMQIADHYESIELKEQNKSALSDSPWPRTGRRTLSFLSHSHSKMIAVSVKVAVLAITSLTSSVLLLGFRPVSFFMAYQTAMDKVASMWIQMDTMISCLCLVLFTPSTQRGFDCLCCCCNVVVSKCMRRSLQNGDVLKRPLLSDVQFNY